MPSRSKPYFCALALLVVAGCEQRTERERAEGIAPGKEPAAERRAHPMQPQVMPARPNPESPASSWENVITSWSEKPRRAAQDIAKKYGAPDEFTQSKLIWHKRGEWKRITVSREEVPHAWPAPHTDIVQQFIDYRVPPEMFDDLAKFDGSVIAERTKGEVSARCGGEAANFLALNLMNDIVTGKKTSRDARTYYANAMKKQQQGLTDPYLEKLVFEVPAGGTADPDKSAEPAGAEEKNAPPSGPSRTEPGAHGASAQPEPREQRDRSTKPNTPMPGAPALP